MMSNSKKILWDDDYLRSFTKKLLQQGQSYQFWEIDENDEVMEYKDPHFRILVEKFLPELGVWNLNLGDKEDGTSIRHLIFLRDGRCQVITSETLRTIMNKVFIYMGTLGDELKSKMIKSRTNPVYTDNFLKNIPEIYDKKPYMDTSTSVCRFFQNGWIEITKDGVSPLRPYSEIPDEYIIWNSNVISRDYVTSDTKELLEKQLLMITSQSIHPLTGVRIDLDVERKSLFQEWRTKLDKFSGEKSRDTHFRDYITNLSKKDDGEVDETNLERLKLSIGFLCHRYHVQSSRCCVVYVDKFHPGSSRDISDGGTGKSLIPKCLGHLMNRTEVNGKKFNGSGNDLFPFGNVPMNSELVHIDDISTKFKLDTIYNHITGDFEIRRMGRVDVIPSDKSPKIVICSNHPIPGEGNSDIRRQFIVEVGNYYKVMSEDYDLTPYEIHGYKHLGTDEWNDTDWSEFYKFVFECISLYLERGKLPRGGESDEYKRQKLLVLLRSSDLLDFLIGKLTEFSGHGEEVFVEVFYKEVRSLFPDETQNIPNEKLWMWLKEVGKMMKLGFNFHLSNKFSLDKQRLTEERWNRWVVEGMEFHKDKNGNVKQKGDRVQIFKVSSLQNPSSMFSPPTFIKNNNTDVGITTTT